MRLYKPVCGILYPEGALIKSDLEYPKLFLLAYNIICTVKKKKVRLQWKIKFQGYLQLRSNLNLCNQVLTHLLTEHFLMINNTFIERSINTL